MRRRSLLLSVLLSLSLGGFAQSPEADALVNFVLAKNVTAVMKHLPLQVHQALQQMPESEREEAGQKFLLSKELSGVALVRGNAPVLLEATLPSNEHVNVVLLSRLSDGQDAVLTIELRGFKEDGTPRSKSDKLDVWMRMDDGEWRVLSIGTRNMDFNYEDSALVADSKQGSQAANEAGAVGSMRTINTAAVTYAATFPEQGYPENLEVMGSSDSPANGYGAEHAGLMEAKLTTPPFEKSGYRFTYQVSTAYMPRRGYAVSARPIQYGTNARRSFFTNESGVIRYTEDDREANEHDPPIQ